MTGQKRHEDQAVLGVLVDADELGPGPPGWPGTGEVLHVGTDQRELPRDPARGANGDRLRRLRPDREIRGAVADVIEAAFPEPLNESLGLCMTGKVIGLVGRKPACEQAEMRGNRSDE